MMEYLQLFGLLLTGVISILVGKSYQRKGSAKAWVIGTGFFVVGFYLDGLFSLIMQGFVSAGSEIMMQILGLFISKCIMVAALLSIKVFAQEEEEQTTGGADAGWCYFDGLTIGISVFFLLIGMGVQWQNSGAAGSLLMMLVLLVVLAAYYISLYLYLRMQKVKTAQFREESRKQEAQTYLESAENNYQRTRELWHDLKNHINLMNLLLQDKKYEELEDYLRIFGEDVDSLTLPAKSGNVIVDALLADKLAKAKRERIEVSLSLCDLTGLKLQPDEICGLLGNLLDNALEANQRLREDRFLEVTCKELEEWYYIRVKNAIVAKAKEPNGNGVPDPVNATLLTTKTDRKNQVGHGIGLRSVERIVHGSGGEMVVDSGEKYFTVVVRLPR